MDRSKLNLNKLSIDSSDEDLQELLIVRQEPESPEKFQEYGDDLDELLLSDEAVLGKEIDEIIETFPQYGEDSDEIVTMEKKHQSDFVEYDVKVKVRRLRYFSGPGTDYVDIGYAIKDSKFTVIGETIGTDGLKWGKLKSYEPAWIPLDYCIRI